MKSKRTGTLRGSFPRAKKGKRRLLQQPQAVVNRWVSRKVSLKAKALVRAYMRWKLPRIERERRKALEEAFETTKYYALRNENGPFPAVSTLLNIGLYLLLAERDIQALKIDMLTHPDEWTRKLHARIVLLTIYEWDADKVSGKALREALDAVQATDELKADAVAALRALRLVQSNARKQFLIVRNKAIAHRDPDALDQFRAIRDLNTDHVTAIAIEFYEGVALFIRMLTKLMKTSGTFSSLLRQWTPKAQS